MCNNMNISAPLYKIRLLNITFIYFSGKSGGVISTTRLTHATPAASYGHVAERYWESDANQNATQRARCKDLARQMIEDNKDIQVNF